MANYRKVARRKARKYGLDPGVFERQIQQESGFNPHARSPAGATGIAQIMPRTAAGWGVNPNKPRQALDAAARNMAGYVKKYGGYENALRAYNAGPGAIKSSRGYSETNNYVRTILGGRHPSSKTVNPRGSGGRRGGRNVRGGATRIIERTRIPGVSNKAARGQLVASFLEDKRSDPVDFALQFRALKDVPGSTSTKRERIPGQSWRIPGKRRNVGHQGGQPTVHGSQVKELIYNDGGKGYGIKNGKPVNGPSFYSGVWAGHANHVHVAAGPKTVVALGKVARRMGLHVGENPHFGGVSAGHVAGSYHFRGEAIDVSGDKAKMAQFARYVKRYSRSR